MSSSSRCPICKKNPHQPINLKCQHHPCFSCAQQLVSVDPSSKIQIKYRLTCPTCSKKTVFYDLRHLILTHSHHQEQEQFVTDKFVGSRQQIRTAQQIQSNNQSHKFQNNYISSEGVQTINLSNPITRRGSIQSLANSHNKMLLDIRCVQHNQSYKYFCSDCNETGMKQCLLCQECSKPHNNNRHRLLSLKHCEAHLTQFNIRNKQEIVIRKGQISFLASALTQSKATIDNYFQQMQQTLSFQFKQIFALLNDKYSKLRTQLRNRYETSIKQLADKMQKLSNNSNILETLQDIELKDLQTNLKFYQTYQKYASSNPIANLKVQIDVNNLPVITKKNAKSDIEDIIADFIEIKQKQKCQVVHAKKSRKSSVAEEVLSHRSQRDKQNRKVGTPTAELKLNLRKIMG